MAADLFMRSNLIIRGSIEESSRDFKEILEMKKAADDLAYKASTFKQYKFDNADEKPQPDEITILIEYQSEEAKKHAERLQELMNEAEKEARAFYKSVGLVVEGPAGKTAGRPL